MTDQQKEGTMTDPSIIDDPEAARIRAEGIAPPPCPDCGLEYEPHEVWGWEENYWLRYRCYHDMRHIDWPITDEEVADSLDSGDVWADHHR